LRGWLAERGDVHPQDLDEVHYSYHDDRAAAHLFAVASGLDSMVVGERQVALQVKQAMEVARHEGSARGVLQRLFGQSVHVGRRVRTETAIAAGASSMVDVGLDAVEQRLGRSLTGGRVAIVGAGKMGALTADRAAAADVDHLDVWNRSEDRARRLVSRVEGRTQGRVVDADGLVDAIAAADVTVCTTGAAEPVLDADLVARAVARREDVADRPLVLLDLAVPRNVDPAAAQLDGVSVIGVADVRELADRGVTGEAIAAARSIVDAEAERFATWTRTAQVEPAIRAMRERAEQVRVAERERLRGKLSGLGEREHQAVEALTRGIVNTLLHEPTVRLKQLADAAGAEFHVQALRELFDLPDDHTAGSDDGEGPGNEPPDPA
ncbi:MAG: glutamyl-tRNA reductase, partial [Nitriliruptoraceae bacterium]